jgi:putative ABC transport system permease protein
MVIGNGLALAFLGIGIGIAAALWAARLMRGLLHEVTPADPATFATVGVVLAAVATAASLVPAWRATRVDPVVALKTE